MLIKYRSVTNETMNRDGWEVNLLLFFGANSIMENSQVYYF